MSSNELPFAAHLFQGDWFRRHDAKLELTSQEVRFIVASLGPTPKRWDGSCQPDQKEMEGILRESPDVLTRIGEGLLAVCIPFPGSGPAVRFLLNQGVSLRIDTNEFNVLHAAAHSGATDSVKVIFESGLYDATCISVQKPHTGWPSNLSLLYWAAWGGYPEFAQVCLDYGAQIHLELEVSGNGERGSTALQEAVAPSHWDADNRRTSGKDETAEILLNAGAQYDIYTACARNDVERVQRLIWDDSSVAGQTDHFGSTPLHWAVRSDSIDCVEELLATDVSLDIKNRSKRTPIQWAAEHDSARSIRILATAGANVNTKDSKGRTPLHRATYEGRVAAIEALIECGADTAAVNNKGKTAFQIARKEALHYRQMK